MSVKNYAPIVLFVYARPIHTLRTINTLKKNTLAQYSDLIVYSDGPKGESDEARVNKVRELVSRITGFKSVHIVENSVNIGLADSIISGVTEVCGKYGSAIVLEDDIVTAPYFLEYMNDGLNFYRDVERVSSIHAFCPKLPAFSGEETFFLRGADCWGWATWDRAWKLFNPNGAHLLKELSEKNLLNKFDLDGSYRFSNMLRSQIRGEIDSWAIRWHASIFLANNLTLHPKKSLVLNIGNDKSGEHCNVSSAYDVSVNFQKTPIRKIEIEESAQALSAYKNFYSKSEFNRKFSKVTNLTKKYIPRMLKNILKRRYSDIVFTGPYPSWDSASIQSGGYQQESILNDVSDAALMVKNGLMPCERDGVLLSAIEYSWPVTAVLMLAAAKNNGVLNVIDFGGALGSSYYQNIKFLSKLKSISWMIVEQEHYVEFGSKEISSDQLKFFGDIDSAVAENIPDLVLFSASLQYIQQPFDVLKKILLLKPQFIVFDRTSSLDIKTSIIAVQHVRDVYKASYPFWIFSVDEIEDFLSEEYDLIESFKSNDFQGYMLNDLEFSFNGFIFSRKN